MFEHLGIFDENGKADFGRIAEKCTLEVRKRVESESTVPEEFAAPDVVYGFGMHIAKTQKNLKWLCVPSAGVDYLMKPGVFANEECLQDRKNCPRRAAREPVRGTKQSKIKGIVPAAPQESNNMHPH